MSGRIVSLTWWHVWALTLGSVWLPMPLLADGNAVELGLMGNRPILVRIAEQRETIEGREVVRQVIEVVERGEVTLSETVLAQLAFGVARQSQAETSVEARLSLVLETLCDEVTLTSLQVEKLQMAARGDFARMFSEFQSLYSLNSARKLSWEEVQALQPQCDSLRHRYERDFLGADSLFRKTLRTMLPASDFDRVVPALKPSLPGSRRASAL